MIADGSTCRQSPATRAAVPAAVVCSSSWN